MLCDGTNSTPDLRAKFVRGAPASTEAGGTGGGDTHTLTIAEIPAHSHSVPSRNYTNAGPSAAEGSSVTGSFNTGSTGGGGAHNNMPAYYQILFIMKS